MPNTVGITPRELDRIILDANATIARSLVSRFEIESEGNAILEGTPHTEARDNILDAILFALDKGWSPE